MSLGTLTGTYRVGTDPDFGFTPNGMAFINFRGAASRNRKLDDGSYETLAEHWANFKAFGTVAEQMNEALTKGISFDVWGSPQTESWDDKDTGEKRYKDVVIVNGFRAYPPRNQQQGGGQSFQQASQQSRNDWNGGQQQGGGFGGPTRQGGGDPWGQSSQQGSFGGQQQGFPPF